jgi:hypothetical protein
MTRGLSSEGVVTVSDSGSGFEQLPILQELRVQLSDAYRAHERTAATPWRGHRRLRGVLFALAVGAVAALLAVGLVAPRRSQQRSLTNHSRTPATSPSTAGISAAPPATIRLAGNRFPLPTGFTASSLRCPATPPAPAGTPITVLGSFQAAASAAGGCLEATLVGADNGPSADAQQVNVGAYAGYVETAGTRAVLYVRIPAAAGHHWLLLIANRVTPRQLIAIAKAGLPASIGPTTQCSSGCG